MPGHNRGRRETEVAVVRPAQPRPTNQAVAGATERRLAGALEVPIEQVAPDVTQPRRNWARDDGERRLDELAASIREFGVLQPLLVREEGTIADGRQRYIIIAGGRRRAAAERAGQSTLPIVVRGDSGTRVRILQLLENLQRQELDPLDEARAFQELLDLESLSPPALAERLHISAQHVRDRLRVLADQVLADAVERRQISATAAREISKLPNDEVMAFRTRVQAGERLQTNDVAAARARLEAAGIINPRRKRAPMVGEQTTFVPRPSTGPSQGTGEAGIAGPHGVPVTTEGMTAPTVPSVPAPSGLRRVGGDGEKQTSFVPTEGQGTPGATGLGLGEKDMPGAADVSLGEEEQTTFVLGDGRSVSADQRAGPDRGISATAGIVAPALGEAEMLLADDVAIALEAGLRGTRRTQVAEALATMRDNAERVEWWDGVYRRLDDRLR